MLQLLPLNSRFNIPLMNSGLTIMKLMSAIFVPRLEKWPIKILHPINSMFWLDDYGTRVWWPYSNVWSGLVVIKFLVWVSFSVHQNHPIRVLYIHLCKYNRYDRLRSTSRLKSASTPHISIHWRCYLKSPSDLSECSNRRPLQILRSTELQIIFKSKG